MFTFPLTTLSRSVQRVVQQAFMLVSDPARTFASTTAGLTAVSDGQTFFVNTTNNEGAYQYTKVGTQARFDRFVFTPSRKAAYDAREASINASLPAGAKVYNDGFVARSFDGRYVPNTLAENHPSLNWLIDPFYVQNEAGGGTPTTTLRVQGPENGVLDSTNVAYAATNQFLAWAATAGGFPSSATPVRFTANIKQVEAGAQQYRIGTQATTAGQHLNVNVTDVFQDVVAPLTLSGTVNVGLTFTNTAGNTAPKNLILRNAGIYDNDAGDILPGVAELKSRIAGHGQRATAYKGGLALTAAGSINHVAQGDRSVSFPLFPEMRQLENYSFGCLLSADTLVTIAAQNALSIDSHNQDTYSGITAAQRGTNLFGQIAVAGAAADLAGLQREGKWYFNPGLNNFNSRANAHIQGNGVQHGTVVVQGTNVSAYHNGVLIARSTTTTSSPFFMRLIAGAYSALRTKNKIAGPLKGVTDQHYFYDRALSDDEIIEVDKVVRRKFTTAGGTLGQRKAQIIGAWDSLTFFAESYFNHLRDARTISPRPFLINEAVGGSNIDSFVSSAGVYTSRYTEMFARIKAAVQTHQECWVYWHMGTNEYRLWDDVAPGVPNSVWNFEPWLVRMINQIWGPLKAAFPTVKFLIATAMPDSTSAQGGDPFNALNYRVELERERYNQFMRDNYTALGASGLSGINPAYSSLAHDRLMDLGLGTYKITSEAGAYITHPVSGGTIAGDFFHSSGALTARPNTPGSAAITLNRTNPAATVASAPAGTFQGPRDIGRRLNTTPDNGWGRVMSVNVNGSEAILDNSDYLPAYPGEPALLQERDRILRVRYTSDSYAAENWSLAPDVSYIQLDGIHPTQAGGRLLCDTFAIPATQQILDSITGSFVP